MASEVSLSVTSPTVALTVAPATGSPSLASVTTPETTPVRVVRKAMAVPSAIAPLLNE